MQEARNTERHTLGWGNTRLRDNAVSFVSAGHLIREEPQSSSQEEEDAAKLRVKDQVQPLLSSEEDVEEPVLTPPEKIESGTRFEQINGTNGHETTATPQDEVVEESSSEDEVVFAGRNGGVAHRPKQQTESIPEPSIKQPVPVAIPRSPEVLTHPPVSSPSDAPMASRPTSERPRRRWESRFEQRRRQQQEEEDAYLQDYIDNMNMDDDDDEEEEEEEADQTDASKTAKPQRRNEHFRFHKGDGLENAKVKLKATQTTKKAIVQAADDDWESADIDDFEDLDTTDAEVDNFDASRILRHRERASGLQYLVISSTMEVSDAKWIPKSKLTRQETQDLIQVYHMVLEERLADSEEDTSEEDDDEEDLIDDIGSEQDENKRIMDRTSRMTDEQIARALAMQEELGMGADEVKLFNGQEAGDLDDEDDFTIDDFMNGDGFIPFSATKHTSNRGRSKRNKRGRDSFPSGEAFADALEQDPYGAFDVMDWDRPSLRAKNKGKKAGVPFDMDGIDEDLADGLINAWTRDREKKTARKREKMEEHQAMLLENAEGANPAAIKLRIRQFLVSESDEMELGTMDAALRASVHRLAKALKLTSRSRGQEGKGVGRYPVLTKTHFTKEYTIENIWEVDALMDLRKFFPKNAYKTARPVRSTLVSRSNRGGVAAASYANGEVVGAAAPEIGSENRGRAMLEKMGWSSGMGIGAVGNKGSVDAIKHVVKTGKAGLG